MFRRTFTTLLAPLLISQLVQAQQVPQVDSGTRIEQRVRDLLSRMTLEEKIQMLSGTGFESRPLERLGIPALRMTDGPVGVRWGKSTAFVSSIAMAATWDTAIVRRIGVALGEEAIGHGRNTLLGPCVNIQRVPQGGRNFESFGEDPYLAARTTVAYIKGVQSTGVVSTVKHFAANNQETNRAQINVKVSERALREIYLPAFEAAVKEAGVLAVMDAYNKVNGSFCTANGHLNIDILKNEWGFKGLLMSDWGATHNTLEAANGGLDLEMPTGKFLNASLLDLIREKKVTEATIDDKILRILRVMMVAGIFDHPKREDTTLVDTPAHRQLNREASRASTVLLKNEGAILPLDRRTIRSIAVIGPNAAEARLGGGGSALVSPSYAVSALEGIRAYSGTSLQVRYAQGCRMEGDVTPLDSTLLHPSAERVGELGLLGEYFPNATFDGPPVFTRKDPMVFFQWSEGGPDPAVGKEDFSVRWTGLLIPVKSGKYTLQISSDDGSRLYLDDTLLVDDWGDHGMVSRSSQVELEGGKAYRIRLDYYQHSGGAGVELGMFLQSEMSFTEAAKIASSSDAALVCVGLSKNQESEGFDRQSLALPEEQVALIHAVVRANPRTIVVLNSGAPLLMEDWIAEAPAVLEQWYPGQEGGNALAELLFGEESPSGKLPCTFPMRWEDCSAFGSYPGSAEETDYTDGVLVGYRHFDAEKLSPRFPFGFGLSYTKFSYRDLQIAPEGKGRFRVSFTVKNTGKRDGAEIAQVYVAPPASGVLRPVKELKGFAKLRLAPGEEKRASLELEGRSFSIYDEKESQWRVLPGEYRILIGASSRDIRLSEPLVLP